MFPAVQRTAAMISVIKQTEEFIQRLDTESAGRLRSLTDISLNLWKDYLPEEAMEMLDFLIKGEGTAQDRVMQLAMNPEARKTFKLLANRFPSHMTPEEHARAIYEKGGLITNCPRCDGLIDPYTAHFSKE